MACGGKVMEEVILTATVNRSELEYVNHDSLFEMKPLTWQVIRPSYLVFLNTVMPRTTSDMQVAEIGVSSGLNALFMLKACKRINLHLVDDYRYDQKPEPMLNLLNDYKDRFCFKRKSSAEAVKEYPDEFFDYVYIDADHDYENVRRDMELWYPKVKYDGMLAGHDWITSGVNEAVHDFIKVHPQRLYGVQRYFEDKVHTYITDEEEQVCDWWFVKRR
jgi:predicted O-methyltransferase YrrM